MKFTSFSIYSLMLLIETTKKSSELIAIRKISMEQQIPFENIRKIVHFFSMNGYFEKLANAQILLSDGIFKDCNNASHSFLQTNLEPDFDRFPHDVSSECQCNGIKSVVAADESIDEALKNGSLRIKWDHPGSFRLEWEHLRIDGTALWFELTAKVYSLEGKDIIIGAFNDITMCERAIKKNQNVDAILSQVIANATDAIISTNKDLRIQMFNESAERIFGYSSGEMIGKSINILMPERYRQGHASLVEDFLPKGENTLLMNDRNEVFGLRKDGTEFPAEASVLRIEVEHGEVLTIMLRDISKQKKYEREIIVAKDEALNADRAKTAFFANMSHELRTPLNAILGFSKLMIDHIFGKLGDEHYEEYVHDINESGNRLLAIINDILDISRIEAEEECVSEKKLEIKTIVNECLHFFTGKLKSTGITINSVIPEELPYILADERMLKQMLINLLSNAVKFIDDGGEVSIEVKMQKDGQIAFSVIDNGIGIAKGDIPIVLIPFRQVDGALSRKFEGTGLGLPLVKAMAELHGGILMLESEINVGTKASIIFPERRLIN